MANSRHLGLKPATRLCAALFALVWIWAVSYCSVGLLYGYVESESHDAQAAHHHDDAAQPHGSHGHHHGSNDGGQPEDFCCDSLKATPQVGSGFTFLKPDFGKPHWLDFISLVSALTFVQPEAAPPRQPPERQWVFTPEVCLGPAFRSHAPPLFA
jgi:hypothetical protein